MSGVTVPPTVQIVEGPEPKVRYFGQLSLWEERLVEGRWEPAYWSPRARIEPEAEIARRWGTAHYPRPAAFEVAVNGQLLRNGWSWEGAEESEVGEGAREVVVRLRHETWPVRVAVHTRLDGTAIFERWLEITNTGAEPLALSRCRPLQGVLCWLDEGSYPADLSEPMCSLGSFTGLTWGNEGDFQWRPLSPGGHALGSETGKSGPDSPFFVVRNDYTGECLVAHLEWSTNWAAELDYRPALDPPMTGVLYRSLSFSVGPEGEAPLRVIEPGETVTTPRVHVGYLCGDLDAGVQEMHEHVRRSVSPALPEGRVRPVTYNHWGYTTHEMTEERLREEINIGAALGAELFIVDAGWFGEPNSNWWETVGDWTPKGRLPRGFGPVVDYAHERGLLFGIWMEAERLGTQSPAAREHPEWVLHYGGKPLPGGPIDLTNPAAAAWLEGEICRLVEEYRLDLFRLDYNTMVKQGGQRENGGWQESTLWRQCEALWGIFDHVRERFPGLLLENCSSGGGRLDLGMMRRFHWTQISDYTTPPRATRTMNGVTLGLPPELCFNFAGIVMEAQRRGDLQSLLRTVLLGVPCLSGIAPSLAEVDPATLAAFRGAIELYKDFIRPMMARSRMWHHTPVLHGSQPAGWCVLEYFSEETRTGMVGVFRLVNDGTETYDLRLRGVRRDRIYRVTYGNSGESVEMGGQALADRGLCLRLPYPMSSELLLIEDAD